MIKFKRTIKTAIQALRRNTMRAFLTALGIIIGISAVIVMMEIGQGSASSIQKSLATMGANNLMIHPGTAASGGISFGSGSITTLTVADSEAIKKDNPYIASIAPIVRNRAQVIYRERNWVPQNIYGSTPEYLKVRNWSGFREGEMFTDRDVKNRAKVAVIGATIARELFGSDSPLGKEIRIRNVTFKVIGVLAQKGANMMGMDQDDIILAPWTTIKFQLASGSTSTTQSTSTTTSTTTSSTTNSNENIYPSTAVSFYPEQSSTSGVLSRRLADIEQILISVRSAEEIPMAMTQIKTLLRQRHRIAPADPDDFNIRDMTEMNKMLTSTTSVMTNLLLCVALVSLVVGGVGIMNIMLVSVTERTREIGLRMALGARARDIMSQFLVESVVLCFFGGIIGIAFGKGASSLVTFFLKWPTETSVIAVVAAFLVSVIIGLVFGYYPAAKAAKLDPIEALRYE